MYTEFISVEGLIRDASKSVQKMDIYDEERPIGIQIFGAEMDSMMRAAEIVEEAQPEVLDINYGCPVKKVVCKMAGAGILQDIDRMVELTKAVVDSTSLPVTVKTRLGWDDKTKYIEEVAERLQDVGIKGLSIHGRTRKQMYKGEADWTLIGKIKENPRIHIPIFGNGDIDSPQKAKEYRERYGVDGIMIGRASIGYPWIFRDIKHYFKTGELLPPPDIHERVTAVRQHLQHSLDWKGDKLGVLEMRRHYSNYFRGYPHIKPFRTQLVTLDQPTELFEVLDQIEERYAEYVL
jgi:nifR3 family TIM-barrel protein